jgi:hypothetical protein
VGGNKKIKQKNYLLTKKYFTKKGEAGVKQNNKSKKIILKKG